MVVAHGMRFSTGLAVVLGLLFVLPSAASVNAIWVPFPQGAASPVVTSTLESPHLPSTSFAEPDTANCTSPPCVVGNITVGATPIGVAYDNTSGEIFVTNENSNNVSVISDKSNTVVASIPVGSTPGGIAYDSGKDEVFVANYNSGNVSIISATTNDVVATFNLTPYFYPQDVVYDAGKGEVFVTEANSDRVAVISDTTDAVVTQIPVGSDPHGMAYDSAKSEVFVANWGSNTVSVISDESDTVIATVDVGEEPAYAAYDGGKGEVFVTDYGSSSVSVISDTSNVVFATVGVWPDPFGIAYDNGTGALFDTSMNQGVTNVISDSTDTEVWNVVVGEEPTGVAFASDSNEMFVANSGANSVSYFPLGLALNATAGPTSGPAPLDVDFYANAFGGSWNYSWAWSFGNGNFSSRQYASQTYTKPGTYEANITVTDSSGNSSSQTIWIEVAHATPFTATLTPSSNSTMVGQLVWVNASIAQGVGPYSFRWNSTPSYAGCIELNSSPIVTCTPTFPGASFAVGVEITDQGGATANATSSNVTVSSVTAKLSSSSAFVSIGQSVLFNTLTSGDPAQLSYAYTSPPAAGCAVATGPSLTCVPKVPGWIFTVTVTVSDPYGNRWNATSPAVRTGIPLVSITPSHLAVDVNESMTLTTQVTGDLASLAFSYRSPTLGGCAPSTSASVVCTPISSGTFSVAVQVTDAYGNMWNATSGTVRVYPALVVNLTTTSSTPLLAQTVAFIANASGGAPPYDYSYTGLPYGCYTENESTIGCLPTQAGWYNISVWVTDSNGMAVRASVMTHVIFDFNVAAPSSTTVGLPMTISVNTNQTFSGPLDLSTPAGGIGVLTYSYSGLPSGCASEDSASITCTPTAVGTYEVTISVHDQAGDHNSHTVVVHVTEGFLGLPGSEGYILMGVVVAVVAVVAMLLLMKRRGQPPSAKTTPEEESEPDRVEDKGETEKEPSPEPEKQS